jgi:hypothetical protein
MATTLRKTKKVKRKRTDQLVPAQEAPRALPILPQSPAQQIPAQEAPQNPVQQIPAQRAPQSPAQQTEQAFVRGIIPDAILQMGPTKKPPARPFLPQSPVQQIPAQEAPQNPVQQIPAQGAPQSPAQQIDQGFIRGFIPDAMLQICRTKKSPARPFLPQSPVQQIPAQEAPQSPQL